MQYQDEVRSVLPATLSLCCCKKKSFFFFFVRQRAADLQRQSKSSRLSNANACMPSAFWSLVATRDATQQSLELATPLPSCHCQIQCICICVCSQNLGYFMAYRGIPLAPPMCVRERSDGAREAEGDGGRGAGTCGCGKQRGHVWRTEGARASG